MTPADLLEDLEAAGVICALDAAGEFVIRAPKGALTAERRDAIRRHRAELVSRLKLSEPDAVRETDPEITPPLTTSEPASDRRRYYMTGARLDSALWAAGYRLCDRCGGLTIHRLVCLKCDPTDASRIAPVPKGGAA